MVTHHRTQLGYNPYKAYTRRGALHPSQVPWQASLPRFPVVRRHLDTVHSRKPARDTAAYGNVRCTLASSNLTTDGTRATAGSTNPSSHQGERTTMVLRHKPSPLAATKDAPSDVHLLTTEATKQLGTRTPCRHNRNSIVPRASRPSSQRRPATGPHN